MSHPCKLEGITSNRNFADSDLDSIGLPPSPKASEIGPPSPSANYVLPSPPPYDSDNSDFAPIRINREVTSNSVNINKTTTEVTKTVIETWEIKP